jgi:hypothetical protein
MLKELNETLDLALHIFIVCIDQVSLRVNTPNMWTKQTCVVYTFLKINTPHSINTHSIYPSHIGGEVVSALAFHL